MIHLVYPHAQRISCPDAIGRHLTERLKEMGYEVRNYDWDDPRSIHPGPNDILLGHPHPFPGTIFRNSIRNLGWKKKIIMSPYNHGDIYQVSFLDPIIKQCDIYLAITGNFWFENFQNSIYAHWKPKMVHLDLAVDRYEFPVLKNFFNPQGERKFLYIGHTAPCKNTGYLSKIARSLSNFHFGWIGSGKTIPGFTWHGFLDFSQKESLDLVAQYDFLITTGKADSNPATILEAMSWGLIPVCTPESGYKNYKGIINIPLNDVEGAVKTLKWLQECPEDTLRHLQALNWQLLDQHFNWNRFAKQVAEAIEQEQQFSLEKPRPSSQILIYFGMVFSPYSYLRPRNLLIYLARKSKILSLLLTFLRKIKKKVKRTFPPIQHMF